MSGLLRHEKYTTAREEEERVLDRLEFKFHNASICMRFLNSRMLSLRSPRMSERKPSLKPARSTRCLPIRPVCEASYRRDTRENQRVPLSSEGTLVRRCLPDTISLQWKSWNFKIYIYIYKNIWEILQLHVPVPLDTFPQLFFSYPVSSTIGPWNTGLWGEKGWVLHYRTYYRIYSKYGAVGFFHYEVARIQEKVHHMTLYKNIFLVYFKQTQTLNVFRKGKPVSSRAVWFIT